MTDSKASSASKHSVGTPAKAKRGRPPKLHKPSPPKLAVPRHSADKGFAASSEHPGRPARLELNHRPANGAPGSNGAPAASDQPFDLGEKVKELLHLAKEQGYLTYNDINDALPSTVGPDDIDEIYAKLHNLEVEIVDQA